MSIENLTPTSWHETSDALFVPDAPDSPALSLRNQSDPYRVLAEQMNEGAATLTADGIILFANRRFAEMLQRPPGYLLGASIGSMLRNVDPPELSQILQFALRGDVRIERDLAREDGISLPVQLSLSLVSIDKSDSVICLVITDRSEMNRARHILQQHSEAFELANDAIVVHSLDGTIRSWNRGAVNIYGWSAAEAIGQVMSDLLHTELPDPLETVQAAFDRAHGWEGEVCQVSRDGRALVVASRWSLLRDEHGEPASILIVNRDITSKNAAADALRESESRFRMLADLVPQFVWMCSPDGQSTYFNQRWVDFTGLTLEQSIGTGWALAFHPDDKQRVREVWNHSVSTGESYRFEGRLRRFDDVYRWFLMLGLPQHDAAGAITGWFGTCTDIETSKLAEAARKLAEQQLQNLNAELDLRVQLRTESLNAINKELEAFSYSVSHDLRAPLRHVDGFLTLLFKRSHSSLDEQSQHFLNRALEASRRMGVLIDDLLQFSRLGRSEIRRIPVNLTCVIDDVRREFEPETLNRSIEWELAPLPAVATDPAMLRQVMQNLIGNALKFTRCRAVAKIAIGSKSGPGGETIFFVRDNGAGFDMRYYDKMFEVFQRLHSDTDFEGTGIGLAIVRRVIERQGGSVWAEGAVEEGATFYFTLPSNQNDTLEERNESQTHLVG